MWLIAMLLGLSFVSAPLAVELRADLWVTDGAGRVHAIAVDQENGVLYIGGEFTAVGPVGGPLVARRNLAALDLDTGEANGWDPGPDDVVRTMWLTEDGTTLYIGGDFTAVGGQFRDRLAALNTGTALPRAWNPGANDSVYAMIPSTFVGASLYVGGRFDTVGGAARDGVAEIGLLGSGVPTGLGQIPVIAPDADVRTLALGATRLFVGGTFSVLVGDDEEPEERRLAAIELDTFALAEWAPPIDDGVVTAMHHLRDEDVVYVGGDFTCVDGAQQTGIAAIDIVDGERQVWNPQLNGPVSAITSSLDRTVLYVGGTFTSVAGVPRARLAAVSVANAAVLDEWQVAADAAVLALTPAEDVPTDSYVLYAGGDFDLIDGAPRAGLASLAALPPEQQAPVTTAIPAGGFFNSINRAPVTLDCDDGLGSGCANTWYTIDGSVPDTESTLYVAPINLVDDAQVRFFSVDHVGNVEEIRSESYEFELDPPLTTADPPSRIFEGSALSVTLSCTDTDSGCADTFYTLDGSAPDTGSARYEGPIRISGTTVLQFFSVDVAGNAEGVHRNEYVRNRGEVGALGWYEALLMLVALVLARARGSRA